VGIPVGLAIMACGGQNVIVDRANAIVTMAGGKKITCIKKLIPGGPVMLAGKDGTIERPATPDEVAAVKLVMDKVAALEGTSSGGATTGTGGQEASSSSGGLLGKLTGGDDGGVLGKLTGAVSQTDPAASPPLTTTTTTTTDTTTDAATTSSDPTPTSGAASLATTIVCMVVTIVPIIMSLAF